MIHKILVSIVYEFMNDLWDLTYDQWSMFIKKATNKSKANMWSGYGISIRGTKKKRVHFPIRSKNGSWLIKLTLTMGTRKSGLKSTALCVTSCQASRRVHPNRIIIECIRARPSSLPSLTDFNTKRNDPKHNYRTTMTVHTHTHTHIMESRGSRFYAPRVTNPQVPDFECHFSDDYCCQLDTMVGCYVAVF